MEWTEMSIETLRRRLGGYLKHKRWYKTSSIDDDFYPFFAACWQHKELRMEILHRIDDWGPARYQTFVECIEAHLPKGDKPNIFNSIKEWEESGVGGSASFSLLRSEPTVKWKVHEASAADTALYEAFIDECCEKGEGCEVRSDTELEPAYREWRIANSDRFPISEWNDSACSDLRNWFWNHYSGLGYSGTRNNDGYVTFYGIRLKDETTPVLGENSYSLHPTTTDDSIFYLLHSKPMSVADDASYPRMDAEDDNTKRWAERWRSHAASGGGEVPDSAGEGADDGITTVDDDVSGGCISLPDEPVMGRRFESEPGKFPSIYLDFVNTYYVRDDAYRVTFGSIWKRFGLCVKKHPSKKVMGQFLMSIGLERMHDTANMTIYQGIRPKSVKVQE
jgi:hypothetical protein